MAILRANSNGNGNGNGNGHRTHETVTDTLALPVSAAPTTLDTNSGVACYLRVSSDEQRRKGSIETQRADVERYLLLHDITPSGWYEDDGFSAYKLAFGQRPAGRQLLADVQAGLVKTIVVWKMNRFGRTARETLNAIHLLEQHGARLISTKEDIDGSTWSGRLYRTILAGIAEADRENIMENSAAGMDRRLREQKWMGGRFPYGYRPEGRDKDAHLVIVEEDAEVVRLVFFLYVVERRSLLHVCDELNAQDIPTQFIRQGRVYKGKTATGHTGPEGRPARGVWQPSTVRKMLRNPAYKGEGVYARGSTLRDAGTVDVPAIVDPEVWEAAQERLKKGRRRGGGHNASRPYLLHSLVTCARCERAYSGGWFVSQKQGDEHRIYFYACNGKRRARAIFKHGHADEGERCESPTVDADELEAFVWKDVERYIRHPDTALDELAKKQAGSADEQQTLQAERVRLQQQQVAKQGERDRVVDAYRKGLGITERDLEHQLAALAREEVALAERVKRLAEREQVVQVSREQLVGVKALLDRLCALLDSGPLTPTLQREAIEGLVDSIVIDREEVGTTRTGKPKYGAVATVTYVFSKPGAQSPLPCRTP
jgi:site-specific DNA recombinase